MTTRSVRAIGLVLATVTALPFAGAEDQPPAPKVEPAVEKEADGGMQIHYTVETGVATTYVFRGVPQYLEKTDPSSMTTLSLTLDKLGPGALTVGAWIAAAITDRDAQPLTKTEIDVTATYTFPIGSMLTGAAGYILYLYPDADSDLDQKVDGAHEFWASLTVNNLPVTPSLGIYVEPIRLDGVYIQAAVTRSFPVGPVVISPWLCLALSKYDALDVDFGLNDITATLPVRWSHESGFYAQASVSYAFNGLDDDEVDPSPSTVYGLLVAGFSR